MARKTTDQKELSEVARDRIEVAKRTGKITLDLSELGLTVLPDSINDLSFTLEELDISGNSLKFLPDEFARFTNLKRLYIGNKEAVSPGNPLAAFPMVIMTCFNFYTQLE